MKRIIYIAQLCTLAFGLSACSDWFLDKEPQDERTDVVYFKKASQLYGWFLRSASRMGKSVRRLCRIYGCSHRFVRLLRYS